MSADLQMEEQTEKQWHRRFVVWGPWFFESIEDDDGDNVFDCISYKRGVFIVASRTSNYGQIEDYQDKLEKLGYTVVVTTKKDLQKFIDDMVDSLDPVYRSGIDFYLIGALN